MPKLIDWGARFELMREAVVRLAARGGAAAVTLDSVAAELRLSPWTLRRTLSSPDVLPGMGVAWIARERRYPRFRSCPKGVERGSVEHARLVIRAELPADEGALERERAWRELTRLDASQDSIELLADHDAYLDQLVVSVLGMILPPEEADDVEAIQLRAVMDGLIRAACRGSVTLEVMCAALDRHIDELVSRADQPLSPDAA